MQESGLDARAEFVPADTGALIHAVASSGAHVLHLFCHGVQSAGSQAFEFATKSDIDGGRPRGSLLLGISELIDAIKRSKSYWLALLNCCSGAEGTAESMSMARQLVERASIPAAIGRATPITPRDAALVSEFFYPDFFRQVGDVLESPDKVIEWATLARAARLALGRGSDRAQDRRWTKWRSEATSFLAARTSGTRARLTVRIQTRGRTRPKWTQSR